MRLLLLLLVLAVTAAVIAVAAGTIRGGLGDPAGGPVGSARPSGPDGWFLAADLDQVRFTPALRGYRMDQVDALLDQLRAQLAAAESVPVGQPRVPTGGSAPTGYPPAGDRSPADQSAPPADPGIGAQERGR